MATSTSTDPKIQQLMDDVTALDDNDKSLEAKLQKIAEAIAAQLKKGQPQHKSSTPDVAADPSDAFACEGCQ